MFYILNCNIIDNCLPSADIAIGDARAFNAWLETNIRCQFYRVEYVVHVLCNVNTKLTAAHENEPRLAVPSCHGRR